jgi:protein disulfide-isomerase
MKQILTVLLVALSLNVFAQQNEIEWHTDIDEAIKISLKTEKPLLLFFTGKDWCGPCKMTAKYVFESKEFAKWSEKCVLVELDFPRGPKRDEIPPKNIEIAQQLNVKSYPTIWFVRTSSIDGQLQLQSIKPIVGGSRDANAWLSQANKILNIK